MEITLTDEQITEIMDNMSNNVLNTKLKFGERKRVPFNQIKHYKFDDFDKTNINNFKFMSETFNYEINLGYNFTKDEFYKNVVNAYTKLFISHHIKYLNIKYFLIKYSSDCYCCIENVGNIYFYMLKKMPKILTNKVNSLMQNFSEKSKCKDFGIFEDLIYIYF